MDEYFGYGLAFDCWPAAVPIEAHHAHPDSSGHDDILFSLNFSVSRSGTVTVRHCSADQALSDTAQQIRHCSAAQALSDTAQQIMH